MSTTFVPWAPLALGIVGVAAAFRSTVPVLTLTVVQRRVGQAQASAATGGLPTAAVIGQATAFARGGWRIAAWGAVPWICSCGAVLAIAGGAAAVLWRELEPTPETTLDALGPREPPSGAQFNRAASKKSWRQPSTLVELERDAGTDELTSIHRQRLLGRPLDHRASVVEA